MIIGVSCGEPKVRLNSIREVQLRSGMCMGECPEIIVSIDSLLNYKFHGGRYALKQGYFTGKVSQGFWDTLNMRFEQIHYQQLRNFYQERSTDGPHWDVIIKYSNNTKYISASPSGLTDSVESVFNTYLRSYTLTKLARTNHSLNFDLFKGWVKTNDIKFPPPDNQ
ncbi:DUF6438 domain-containing protein [Mucilaginibacter paludis]|nr:DUF6438 domain-containing protein [Mucilaginibacter paludis]